MTKACRCIPVIVTGSLLGALPCGAEPMHPGVPPDVATPAHRSRPDVPAPRSLRLAQTTEVDTPVEIISDQIRRQGYACDEPRQAARDRQASRPNETVWILRCNTITYRVILVPDMAARVERVE